VDKLANVDKVLPRPFSSCSLLQPE